MSKFYATGWQAPTQQQAVGQLINFREAFFTNDEMFKNYVSELQFTNAQSNKDEATPNTPANSLISKFENAITALENVLTNGNNTEVPFYRTVTESLVNEYARCIHVTEQLSQQMNPLTDFEKIRLFIVTQIDGDATYRFYINALRTVNIKTRFLLTSVDSKLEIASTKGNSKVLHHIICYAEKITDKEIVQYIFDTNDYEAIFGLNEKIIDSAITNYSKFLSAEGVEPEYKVAGEYTVRVSSETEMEKIKGIIEKKRKISNALSKYNNEASEYSWEDVLEANAMSEDFMQTPFAYDDVKKEIILTADSFEAWVSVISDAKKIAVASKRREDRLADGTRQKNVNSA